MSRALLATVVFACAVFGQTPEARRWVEYWAAEYGVERELVYAVIEAESGWNGRAVSPAGAVGLMQLMPDTAVTFRVRSRLVIAENIRGGVAYLAWLKEPCRGDRRLILASYIAGHNRVLRQGLTVASEEVHNYVKRVAFLYRRNRWEALLQSGRRVMR
jgi:soluble lytic murein transglycosylase-like protein